LKLFGTMLREERIEKRITLRRVAEAAGMSPSEYSRVERNVSPAPDDIAPILTELDVMFASPHCISFIEAAEDSRRPGGLVQPTEQEILGKLPAILCGMASALRAERLDALAEAVRESSTP
jgi:transcriptional regulator with XRE-family HTH domain